MTARTPLEDRLAAALAARADLVQPDTVSAVDRPAAVVPLASRRRRATVLAAAAVAAVAVVATVVTTTGDGGDADPQPVAPDAVPDRLVLTTGGRAPVTVPELVAGCVASETQPGSRVFLVVSRQPRGPRFHLAVPESELDLPLRVELPYDVDLPDGSSSEDHTVFAAVRGNEASGSEEGAAGSFEILAAGCDIGADVRVRVDARLGSELGDGAPVDVRGGVVTESTDLAEFFGGE